jgi:hypothetical protein
MNYNDWRDNFSTLFLNVDFPEDWTGVRFKSKWTKSNAGGLPNKYVPDEELGGLERLEDGTWPVLTAREKFALNPQFYVKPYEDTEMMFSMTQMGGRLPINGQYFTYPFSETLNYGAVSIFKVDEGKTNILNFDKDKLVYMTPVKGEKENSGRVKLDKD